MKIATYEFRVSNGYGTKDVPCGAWSEKHNEHNDGLYSADDIDREINKAIALLEKHDCEIVDVRTNFVTIQHHNNGGCDFVMAYVTILYK